VRRFLDYGRRLKAGQGMEELYQWTGRILLDESNVYSLEERALALEIGFLEKLADQFAGFSQTDPQPMLVSDGASRLSLYRQILIKRRSPEEKAGIFCLLRDKYRRHASWIEERGGRWEGDPGFEALGGGTFWNEFSKVLGEIDPLPGQGGGNEVELEAELERLKEEKQQQEKEKGELQGDLEFAEDRATRAHQRLRQTEEEIKRLRKSLQEARVNGDKLRNERRTRIKSERESGETRRELDRLKKEFVKQDRRLQEMARRLVQAEQRHLEGGGGELHIDLPGLRKLGPGKVLGVEGRITEEDLGQIRRRFAAVFHSDRANQLPAWVRGLCDEVLGVVNEACDRFRKQ
jgi:hypothetical protein